MALNSAPIFDPNGVYEVHDIATKLNVPLYQITNPAKDGRLPCSDLGTNKFVTGANLLAFLSSGSISTRKNPGAVAPGVRIKAKKAAQAVLDNGGTEADAISAKEAVLAARGK